MVQGVLAVEGAASFNWADPAKSNVTVHGRLEGAVVHAGEPSAGPRQADDDRP
jgi:hypothetical protein